MGRYRSVLTNTLPNISTQVSFNHNIGSDTLKSASIFAKCISADIGYSAGDLVTNLGTNTSGYGQPIPVTWTYKTIGFSTSNATSFVTMPKAGGTVSSMTLANWAYGVSVERGW
jgi:hypothetical protein